MSSMPQIIRFTLAASLLVAVGLPVAIVPVRAQTPARQERPPLAVTPEPGQWIRARYADRTTREGRLVRVADSGLVVVKPGVGDTVVIPRTAGVELWVRGRGMHHTGAGLGMGALAGAALGAIYANASYTPCDGKTFCLEPFDQGTLAIMGAVAGGALGAVVGGAIGSAIVTYDWQRVDHPLTGGLATTGRGRLALSLSLRR